MWKSPHIITEVGCQEKKKQIYKKRAFGLSAPRKQRAATCKKWCVGTNGLTYLTLLIFVPEVIKKRCIFIYYQNIYLSLLVESKFQKSSVRL